MNSKSWTMANNLNDALGAIDKLSDEEFLEMMARSHRRHNKIVNGLEEKKKALKDEFKRLFGDAEHNRLFGNDKDELVLG